MTSFSAFMSCNCVLFETIPIIATEGDTDDG